MRAGARAVTGRAHRCAGRDKTVAEANAADAMPTSMSGTHARGVALCGRHASAAEVAAGGDIRRVCGEEGGEIEDVGRRMCSQLQTYDQGKVLQM